MSCPKCGGQMRQYERSGLTVDQCNECRGIFLDRGELERLIDAENAWHGGGAPRHPQPQAPAQPYPQAPYRRYDSDEYPRHGHGHGRKRRGFLDELFG